ncbi:S-adenosyl-L-methionine-dependent methyltransferase [Ilyonectria robusta]|uniref:S-adenosyl-L-methionine-dependent methyltransferase n=1 Tax=Ilyonectria robusta TaxID=1079257 RepID=UPI001E8E1F50|nr:S-adenosyl-L-methionine-dependent methyltransferase [Ilyonectria robusta]KAH8699628.1 S-adenosyl-L-methionine-dependent methyltransferase [Ilyonectria robusta]
MKENETPLYATPELSRKVTEYSAQHSTPLPKYITDFHASIAANRDDSYFMSSNFQSQWNYVLARSIGAKRVLEIGVYVGYSAMVWSHAVGPEGRVTGLEFEPKYAKIANDAFAANRIMNVEIVVGPAAETLSKLSPSEPYDIVFIDADKTGYPGYLKQLLEGSQPGSTRRLLRPGALVVSDNVLRRGLVADLDTVLEEDRMKHILAVREFNDLCVSNPRLETFLLPLWDGVNITRLVD